MVQAASAEEALDLTRAGTAVDVLLTDLVLPGMNGLELARRLRGQKKGLPVVCMSGHVDPAFGSCLPREEGISFVPKPFEADSLARKIRAALDG